jgi:hypothetical protein
VGRNGHRDFTGLVDRLWEPVAALGMSREELRSIKPVFHLAIAAAKDPDSGAPVDRTLSDADWADIAGEYAGLGSVRRHQAVPPYPRRSATSPASAP